MFCSPLRPGDGIGVIAPANAIAPDWLAAGVAEIHRAGFAPIVHPQCSASWGRFAGTESQRLDALHETYANPKVKAIIAARGGYGVLRLIDKVDFDLIRANPKPLIGYSDLTALLNPIAERTGQPALLGPMLGDLRAGASPASQTWAHLWAVLRGEVNSPDAHPASQQARVMRSGTASGPLCGGNLAILAAMAGTPTEPDYRGKILILEDVGEELYRFDRMLGQLARAGVFDKICGLIMGELVDVADTSPPAFGQSAQEIVHSYIAGRDMPVLWNYPCGHGLHRTVLPLGVHANLTATADFIKITHDLLFDAP